MELRFLKRGKFANVLNEMEMGTHKRSDFDEKAPWRKFQEIAKETREKRAVWRK